MTMVNHKLIDRMNRQIDFFTMVYDEQMDILGTFEDNQHMRLLQMNDKYSKVKFFSNVHKAIEDINNSRCNTNTYFNLSLTDGTGGTESNLKTRSVIALDFDKKDFEEGFSHKDLIDKFKSIKLWYHALVDSGNGYHAYICIKPTNDYKKLLEVTQGIGKRLGADINAMKSTQILRVPFTFNIKDVDNQKHVNIFHIFDRDTIERYDIDRLHKRFCIGTRDNKEQGSGDRVTNFTINNTNIPSCIEKVLLEGSKEGQRYEDLKRIVVTLRDRNKSLGEIQSLCREWSEKSNYNDKLSYRVEHIYNSLKYVQMECESCKDSTECFDKVTSNFDFADEFGVLIMNETQTSKLKSSTRKGVKVMESNDLLIYSILKNHSKGLYRDEIIEELTYKKKCRFSKDTLTKALKSLEDNEFIEVSGRPKFYKLKPTRNKIELTYKVSYGATYEAVKGNISTDELRLYNYMRCIHNKQQREDSRALKGNLLQVNQVDLAKELGLTQGRISQMIDKLLDELLLGIDYRQASKNNGFDYNIYRLQY